MFKSRLFIDISPTLWPILLCHVASAISNCKGSLLVELDPFPFFDFALHLFLVWIFHSCTNGSSIFNKIFFFNSTFWKASHYQYISYNLSSNSFIPFSSSLVSFSPLEEAKDFVSILHWECIRCIGKVVSF